MRNAEAVLEIIQKRGEQKQPLSDVYRQLYNPDLYLKAYARIYSHDGAMTKGTSQETADGMSQEKIYTIIDKLRFERYKWTPVRRTYIPKKNGKRRPLSIPTWSDKLLQEVIRLILEAYYEPQFSKSSHGFRPKRGPHTALEEVWVVWRGVKWFIEGDISQYFDTIDHYILLKILGESIKDERFLRLIGNLLRSGYLEDWKYNRTISGAPQGGIVSPILANIYLDRFDKFVSETLIPDYTKGKNRAPNPEYVKLSYQAAKFRKLGNFKEMVSVRKKIKPIPSKMPYDPNYRRLRYVRYADDFLLGFAGTKQEAREIKDRIKKFLQDTLKLELSEEKTLITNANQEKAKFLGYDLFTYLIKGRKQLTGQIATRVPGSVIEKKRAEYMKNGKAVCRKELIQESDYDIVTRYQAEYRGLVQYYILAPNIHWFNLLHWTMSQSLLKTLANKHKTSPKKMLVKLKTQVDTPYGKRLCLEVRVSRGREGKPPLIARFGGIPLIRKKFAEIKDLPLNRTYSGRNELLKRLLAEVCELCGSTEKIEVHHIRKLKDLKVEGHGKEKPLWVQRMAARKRKTLVLCRSCHDAIHSGKSKLQFGIKSLASRVQ